MTFYAMTGRKQGNSRDFGYVLGVLHGDACVYQANSRDPSGQPRRSWRVELQAIDAEFVWAFAHALARTVKRPEKRRPHVWLMPRRPGRAPTYRMTTMSKSLGEWWHGADIDELRRIIAFQPAAFLRGLYDSEGSYSRGGARIFSTSEQTMTLAVEALALLGMNGHPVVFRPTGATVKLPNGEPWVTKTTLYMLAPTPSVKFFELVGSSIPRKVP